MQRVRKLRCGLSLDTGFKVAVPTELTKGHKTSSTHGNHYIFHRCQSHPRLRKSVEMPLAPPSLASTTLQLRPFAFIAFNIRISLQKTLRRGLSWAQIASEAYLRPSALQLRRWKFLKAFGYTRRSRLPLFVWKPSGCRATRRCRLNLF